MNETFEQILNDWTLTVVDYFSSSAIPINNTLILPSSMIRTLFILSLSFHELINKLAK